MTKPKIIIVNENDQIIGYKERATLNQEDIYRVSALWIQNSQGDILMAQRSFSKKNYPGNWSNAVDGTNEEGESYESNIIKEAEEEIGLKNFPFQKVKKIRAKGLHNFFGQLFLAVVDKDVKDFKVNKEEIEEIKWFKKEVLSKELENNPDKFESAVKDCVNLFNNISTHRM